jgi:hypothetical protein
VNKSDQKVSINYYTQALESELALPKGREAKDSSQLAQLFYVCLVNRGICHQKLKNHSEAIGNF